MRITVSALAAVAFLLAASTHNAYSYQVALTAEVSKAEVMRSESFTYKLSVIEEGSPDGMTRLVPPDFTGFRVTSTSSQSSVQVARDKARKVTENVYRLSSDMPGEHVIPPARLVMTDPRSGQTQEMTSNEVALTVLDKEQGVIGAVAGDIRDIKEPKTLVDRVKLYFYGFLALALLALIILIGFAMYVVGKKKKAAAARPAPAAGPGPREAALAELEKARSIMADTRGFYTAAADAVRRYLGAAYGMAAMEATTQEIIERAGRTGIPAARVGAIGGFFTRADMVKFAKHAPDDEEKAAFYEAAVSLVREL